MLNTIAVVLGSVLAGLSPALPASSHPVPAPRTEVRAVWVTTAAGLDWPSSNNRAEQQASLRRIVRAAHQAGLNTLFFQVRARGDAYYRSRYEPWAENLTGVLGQDPGWDPLALLLTEAHALGMEVHAWFNVYKIRGLYPVPQTTPEHPSRTLAAWTVEQDGEVWLDPGRPEVRRYLINVLLDIVRSYDIDGINFDFVRYPGLTFSDQETYLHFGRGLGLREWRRQNVTAFVRAAYQEISALRPRLKIGSSPLGVYKDDQNGRQRGSYYSVFQDSYGWLQEGIQDYLAPQVYWVINPWNNEPDFARVIRLWSSLPASRHIYAGIAAYRPEVRKELGVYIDSSRTGRLAGQAMFRWENIVAPGITGRRYASPANIPPMPWKDAVPPLPVKEVRIRELASGVFSLEWDEPPPASDGERALYFNVYRWTNAHIPLHLPEALLRITSRGERGIVDSTATDGRTRFFYAVTAFDRLHNESAPSPVVSTHADHFALRSQPMTPRPTSLSVAVEHQTGRPMGIHYTLPDRTHVALDILRRRVGIPDTIQVMLVRARQDEGTYNIVTDKLKLPPGSYLLRLSTDWTTIEQGITVEE